MEFFLTASSTEITTKRRRYVPWSNNCLQKARTEKEGGVLTEYNRKRRRAKGEAEACYVQGGTVLSANRLQSSHFRECLMSVDSFVKYNVSFIWGFPNVLTQDV